MAWSYLQSAGAAPSFTAGPHAAYGSNLTAGSKLIAVVCAYDGGVTCTGVSDASANAFTNVASEALDNDGSSYGQLSAWALDCPAGDAGAKPVITGAISGDATAGIQIAEVSGLLAGNTSAMLDGTPGTDFGLISYYSGTATPFGSPTYSSAAANEFLFLAFAGNTLEAAASGLTNDSNNAYSGGSPGNAMGMAYGNSTGGAESQSFNYTVASSAPWAQILVAFKLPAAHAGGLLMASFP